MSLRLDLTTTYDPAGEGRDRGILVGGRSFNLRKGSLVHIDWQTPNYSMAMEETKRCCRFDYYFLLMHAIRRRL